MEVYITTDTVEAEEMSRFKYLDLTQSTAGDGDLDDSGFYVVTEEGEKSWMTTEEFNAKYRLVDTTTPTEVGLDLEQELMFEDIFDVLSNGYEVTRKGWTPDGMYLVMDEEGQVIYRYFADGTKAEWRPSQADMFATNWKVVADENS